MTSAGTSYQYWRDAAGRVAWTRQWANAGAETFHFDNTYTFDPLDRIATRQFPDASLFTYVYDGTRLAEIQGPAEHRWPLRDAQYDASGRPLTLEIGRLVISSTPVSPATLAFEYDDPGERLSRITGTRHEPTGSGNPLVTSDQVFDFGLTFDGLGRLREQVVAGQGERSFDYDGLSRLKTATGPWARPNPSGPLEQTTWTLSYDALGNLRSLTSAPHTFSRTWSYEDPIRPRFLTRFDQNRYGTVPQAQTAAPDAAGAIATRDRTGLPDTFTWNAHNRLFSISGKGFEYHYDAFGQRTRTKVVVGETNTSVIYVGDDFEYDTQAQQANLHFFLAGRRIASFASFGDYYSAGSPPPWVWRFGLRAGPPVVVGMALLGLFGLAAVALGRRQPRWLTGAGVGFISGAFIALPYFVWAGGGGGGPSQLGSHGEIDGVYYLTDHLGSSRAVVNLNGELLEQRDYDPFGLELAPESDDYNLKHAFTGQPLHEVDADLEIPPLYQTGLYHYGARMYDPLWGRFISPDSYVPALDAEGLNRYSYARNNPTSLVDPTGNFFDFQWPSSFGLTGFTDSGLNSGLRGMTAAVGTSTLGISPDAYQRWLAQCEGCWPPDPYEPVLTYIAEDEDDSWFLQNMRHLRRTVNHIYGNVRNLRALTKIIAAPPRESQAEQPQRDPTVWPTKYGEVKDPFDPTGTLNPAREGQPHLGIDIVNPLGEPVFASDTGEVLDVYYNARGGNQIRVLDLDRGVEGYAHTRPIEGLSPGQKVRAGDVIGYSDASGRIRGPHLHYTYRPCPTCARVDPMTHLPR